MLDGLRDHAAGDQGLPETHLVGDEETMSQIIVEIETPECVYSRRSLKILQAAESLLEIQG
jgi:hypothetical protein